MLGGKNNEYEYSFNLYTLWDLNMVAIMVLIFVGLLKPRGYMAYTTPTQAYACLSFPAKSSYTGRVNTQ